MWSKHKAVMCCFYFLKPVMLLNSTSGLLHPASVHEILTAFNLSICGHKNIFVLTPHWQNVNRTICCWLTADWGPRSSQQQSRVSTAMGRCKEISQGETRPYNWNQEERSTSRKTKEWKNDEVKLAGKEEILLRQEDQHQRLMNAGGWRHEEHEIKQEPAVTETGGS